MAKEKVGMESGTASREFLERRGASVEERDLKDGERRRSGVDVEDKQE